MRFKGMEGRNKWEEKSIYNVQEVEAGRLLGDGVAWAKRERFLNTSVHTESYLAIYLPTVL